MFTARYGLGIYIQFRLILALQDLHQSRVIQSRRKRWVGHVAGMGERRDVYRVLVGKHEGKRPVLGIDGRII